MHVYLSCVCMTGHSQRVLNYFDSLIKTLSSPQTLSKRHPVLRLRIHENRSLQWEFFVGMNRALKLAAGIHSMVKRPGACHEWKGNGIF